MSTFLFNEIIFGPIHSRRLGNSLGINLLPQKKKYCNFNCIYCECGNNIPGEEILLPQREDIAVNLEKKLAELKSNGGLVDSITFAGNGEPTIHPHFAEIINDTIKIRDKYFPSAKVSVLSNATMINKPEVFDALNKVDMNILKIDSALNNSALNINRPTGKYSVENIVNLLKQFNGKFILQTMFLSGNVNGIEINNMDDNELSAWLNVVQMLKPQLVMIYTIARDTPESGLIKATPQQLDNIKLKIEKLGVKVQVSY